MPTDPAPVPIDALLAAAGIDAAAGVQVVAAARCAEADATLATIVLAGGAGDPSALLAKYPPDTPVRPLVSDGAGGAVPGSPSTAGAVAAGRGWEAPGLIALALPALDAEEVRGDLRGLVGVIRRVRDPDGGCPWDLAQDHASLRPHLLEETYEVLEALDGLARPGAGPEARDALREELGDLLMQIVLHARLAEQSGDFTLGDVAEGIRSKLVRRHPHVFGEEQAATPGEVERNWEALKAEERKAGGGRGKSALDGVPAALPALARAQRLSGRAARGGAGGNPPDVPAALSAALSEALEAAVDGGEASGAVGDLLFAIGDLMRRRGIEAEDALREACARFEQRFREGEEA